MRLSYRTAGNTKENEKPKRPRPTTCLGRNSRPVREELPLLSPYPSQRANNATNQDRPPAAPMLWERKTVEFPSSNYRVKPALLSASPTSPDWPACRHRNLSRPRARADTVYGSPEQAPNSARPHHHAMRRSRFAPDGGRDARLLLVESVVLVRGSSNSVLLVHRREKPAPPPSAHDARMTVMSDGPPRHRKSAGRISTSLPSPSSLGSVVGGDRRRGDASTGRPPSRCPSTKITRVSFPSRHVGCEPVNH
jgi:hypothetical protein